MPLRICYHHSPKQRVWQEDDGPDGGHFEGIPTVVLKFRVYLNMVQRIEGRNFSIVGASSVGSFVDPVTLTYDGCLGR